MRGPWVVFCRSQAAVPSLSGGGSRGQRTVFIGGGGSRGQRQQTYAVSLGRKTVMCSSTSTHAREAAVVVTAVTHKGYSYLAAVSYGAGGHSSSRGCKGITALQNNTVNTLSILRRMNYTGQTSIPPCSHTKCFVTLITTVVCHERDLSCESGNGFRGSTSTETRNPGQHGLNTRNQTDSQIENEGGGATPNACARSIFSQSFSPRTTCRARPKSVPSSLRLLRSASRDTTASAAFVSRVRGGASAQAREKLARLAKGSARRGGTARRPVFLPTR